MGRCEAARSALQAVSVLCLDTQARCWTVTVTVINAVREGGPWGTSVLPSAQLLPKLLCHVLGSIQEVFRPGSFLLVQVPEESFLYLRCFVEESRFKLPLDAFRASFAMFASSTSSVMILDGRGDVSDPRLSLEFD